MSSLMYVLHNKVGVVRIFTITLLSDNNAFTRLKYIGKVRHPTIIKEENKCDIIPKELS